MSPGELGLTHIAMRELRIPLVSSFRHASAERVESSSVWVEIRCEDGTHGCGEGCPRTYVTGETVDSARAFLADHEVSIRRSVTGLASLRAWAADHKLAIDANPAAWCAVELALLDLVAQAANQPVEVILGLPRLSGSHQYTAVLGDAEPDRFHGLATRYLQHGFKDFKVKLSADTERDRRKLQVFRDRPASAARVRADANNVWGSADHALVALHALEFPFFAVEEPIQAGQYEALARLAGELRTRIVLDESVLRPDQLEHLGGCAEQWIVNVRVSKMGGLIRALDVIATASARGHGIVVGAQVGETSLLTRAGLTAAAAAGQSLVAREGAFGTHLLSRDVCDPPLMFGRGGILEVSEFPRLQAAGLGGPLVAPS